MQNVFSNYFGQAEPYSPPMPPQNALFRGGMNPAAQGHALGVDAAPKTSWLSALLGGLFDGHEGGHPSRQQGGGRARRNAVADAVRGGQMVSNIDAHDIPRGEYFLFDTREVRGLPR